MESKQETYGKQMGNKSGTMRSKASATENKWGTNGRQMGDMSGIMRSKAPPRGRQMGSETPLPEAKSEHAPL
jgi:hypothetical protein